MLALSDEGPKEVDGYLRKEGFTVPTGISSRSKSAYGVTGIPKSFLIGPEGTVLWRGHPRELTRARLEELIGEARAPEANGFLGLRTSPGARMHASLKPASEAAEAGRLAEALATARVVAATDEESDTARAAASSLVREVEEHVLLLQRQVEHAFESREALAMVQLLRGLATALAGTEAGEAAGARLAKLEQDEQWSRELAGARALDAATQSSIGEGKAEKRRAYTAVAEQYAGTRAAERARRWAKRK